MSKDLRKIDARNRRLIVKKIQSLAANPRPEGVSKLKATDSLHRVRVGDYRIIYEIIDNKLIITIIKIGHRSRVYGNHN